MIGDSEMTDFNRVIGDAGFDPDDFNAIAVEDDPTTAEPQNITGTVTVHRISNDASKTYRAGMLSTWVGEFDIDLNSGVFGQK